MSHHKFVNKGSVSVYYSQSIVNKRICDMEVDSSDDNLSNFRDLKILLNLSRDETDLIVCVVLINYL